MKPLHAKQRLPLTQPGLEQEREAQFLAAMGVSMTVAVILFVYLI